MARIVHSLSGAATIVTLALASLASAGCDQRAGYCTFVREGNGPRGQVSVRAELVASGLDTPWGIAFVTPTAMLVTERKGTLRLVTGSDVVPEPVATVPAHEQAESGLLGIALAPTFATTRQFFLYYTHEKDGHDVNRIERWVLAPDARSAAPEKILVDDIPASPAHDGGRLRIGPDGMLYAGTGDARDRDLPPSAESNAGKVLRMTVDGAAPPDNPWPGRLAFVKGVRNVEAFDWLDPKTGEGAERGAASTLLVVADHGPSGELGRRGNDEVTVAERGADLGWPDTYGCEATSGVTSPSLAWSKAVPPGGAAFYRGTRIPEWRGSLLVGSLGAKHLHRVVFDRADPRHVVLHEVYFDGDPPNGLGRIRDVVMGPDGELYVTTSNCDGRGTCPADGDKIFRITR
jgi:glucose/arabinose dehydrogenase